MTNQIQNKHDNGINGINPVVAALAGAVAGAGVAIAGAVALNDEKNRDKVKEVLNNAKKQATTYVEDVKDQIQDKKEEVEKDLTEGKKK